MKFFVVNAAGVVSGPHVSPGSVSWHLGALRRAGGYGAMWIMEAETLADAERMCQLADRSTSGQWTAGGVVFEGTENTPDTD